MSKTMFKKVGVASLIMMSSVFLSRFIGLIREMVIAYRGGAGSSVDAYQIAFVIPEILNHIAAGGFLSITFIPIFTKYLAEENETKGCQVFSNIMTVFGSGLILVIAVFWIFADKLINVVAPGLTDPEQIAAAVRMTRIIMPAQFFFFSGGLFMAVQFAKEQFYIPALAPLIYNIGIIAGGVLFSDKLGMEGFSWGVLAGAFIGNFALQAWGVYKTGIRYRIRFDIKSPDLKKYILLSLPLMLGLTMMFSTEVFLKFFGSYLPEGSIAALNYGLRIMLILVGFFGQAVGMASFPFMARMVAENKIAQLNLLLNKTLRYLALIIPFAVLFVVLRYEIVFILFQRGRFDAQATALTSQVIIYLMIGAVAFSVHTLVVRGYYAMQDTLFPAVFGTIAVGLSIPFYFYGMQKMGVTGVASAISISAIFQAGLLYAIWNRRTENADGKGVYLFYIKIVCISVPIGVFLEWFKRQLFSEIVMDSLPGCLLSSVIIGLIFIIIFIMAGYIFQIKEISDFARRLIAQVEKRMTF